MIKNMKYTYLQIFFLFLLGYFLGISPILGQIDRQAVVNRHRVVTTKENPRSPAQVGNGEFAFGVDVTGLQTFTHHYTMSNWGWHSFPLSEGLNINDFEGKLWDFYGRQVLLPDKDINQPDLTDWLCGNPHRFNLGRIGLILKKTNGEKAKLNDLANTKQEIDLWTGVITSTFELENMPITVKTVCHTSRDAIGIEIVSPLIENGQLEVEISFPYPDKSGKVKNTYDYPYSHYSKLEYNKKSSATIRRVMDDATYSVLISWNSDASMKQDEKSHFFRLVPGKKNKLNFVCEFSSNEVKKKKLTYSSCAESSIAGWKSYWESGAAIDLSESKDARWKELERRIILSQYLMKVNEAGSLPPQESGLVNNGWFGRFHFEMIWWHGVHYALWNRWSLFDKYLHIFTNFLPTSIERAEKQGFKGARWPKCTGNVDREWPGLAHATLVWQQPHPIYFAELDYRLHPTRETLEKWANIIVATADFMADFAYYDKDNKRYALGPPLYMVSENKHPSQTLNPTFELSYWRFGLRVAQTWMERMGKPRIEKWDQILSQLAPLPIEDGVYVTFEGIQNMWTQYTFEHPALIGVFGMLPGDGVDTLTFARTLDKVFAEWQYDRIWGWDYPMMAMAAARIGRPEKAVDMLLYPSKQFQFDQHGLATGGPFPYFPSNGGLLTAIAFMAAGWDGCPNIQAPGFPQDGTWTVKWEGLKTSI